MSDLALIRATSRLLQAADPSLGESPTALRLVAYNHQIRASGLNRDEEHQLRVKAGLRLQRELSTRPHALQPPVPPNRALVVAGPLDYCERHPLAFA